MYKNYYSPYQNMSQFLSIRRTKALSSPTTFLGGEIPWLQENKQVRPYRHVLFQMRAMKIEKSWKNEKWFKRTKWYHHIFFTGGNRCVEVRPEKLSFFYTRTIYRIENWKWTFVLLPGSKILFFSSIHILNNFFLN